MKKTCACTEYYLCPLHYGKDERLSKEKILNTKKIKDQK
jgi:hypothetical protein